MTVGICHGFGGEAWRIPLGETGPATVLVGKTWRMFGRKVGGTGFFR